MSALSLVLLVLAIPAVMGLAQYMIDFHKEWTTSAWIEFFIEWAIVAGFIVSLTGVH